MAADEAGPALCLMREHALHLRAPMNCAALSLAEASDAQDDLGLLKLHLRYVRVVGTVRLHSSDPVTSFMLEEARLVLSRAGVYRRKPEAAAYGGR